jgi:hypothetical protein
LLDGYYLPLLSAAAQSLPALTWQWVVIVIAALVVIAAFLIESIKILAPIALFVGGLVLLALAPGWLIVGIGMFGVGVLLLVLQYKK